jgi:hypothetical protein
LKVAGPVFYHIARKIGSTDDSPDEGMTVLGTDPELIAPIICGHAYAIKSIDRLPVVGNSEGIGLLGGKDVEEVETIATDQAGSL